MIKTCGGGIGLPPPGCGVNVHAGFTVCFPKRGVTVRQSRFTQNSWESNVTEQ